jgi:transposase
MFKESRPLLKSVVQVLADTGYQGIAKVHASSTIPIKKKKGQPLTKEQKQFNHQLSSKRIIIENVIGYLKRFRIISDRYRNRRKRFGLRFNLIAGVHNYELR